MLAQIGTTDSIELLLSRLNKTAGNKEFLANLTKPD